MGKKLIFFIENKSEYHVLIQNRIDRLAESCVASIEESIELYTEKCLPVIEQDIPAPIRNRSNELLAEAEEHENEDGVGRRVTADEFSCGIRNTVRLDILRNDARDAKD